MKGSLYESLSLLSRIDRRYMTINESMLLESMSLGDVRQKYYPNVPEGEFTEIVGSDPTSGPDKMGKYSKWLLSLYLKGSLKLEDLYKAKEYLNVFNRYKGRMERKDIGQYASLPDLYDAVKPFEGGEQAASKGEEVRRIKQNGAEKVYEDSEWLVIVPKTEEAAIYYGKGTQWCTAATGGRNYFEYYNNDGPLYININKQTGKKYQFHFESSQFMDETDRPVTGYTISLSEGLREFYLSRYKGKAIPLLCEDPDEGEYLIRALLDGGAKPEEVFTNIDQDLGNGVLVVEDPAYEGYNTDPAYALLCGNDLWYDRFNFIGKEHDGWRLVEFYWENNYGRIFNFMRIGNTIEYLDDEGFVDADDFCEGLARVYTDEGSNYIRPDGTYLTETWFDKLNDFGVDEYTVGEKDGKEFLLYRDGRIIGGYDKVYEGNCIYKGITIVTDNGKKNVMSTSDGSVLLPSWYENVLFLSLNEENFGYVCVMVGGSWYVMKIGGGSSPLFDMPIEKVVDVFRDGQMRFVSDGVEYFGTKDGRVGRVG